MSHTAGNPGGVTIRPAERADLLAVLRIERASFPQPWPYDAFEWFLGEPGFLVAVDDGSAGGDGSESAGGEGAGSAGGDGSESAGGTGTDAGSEETDEGVVLGDDVGSAVTDDAVLGYLVATVSSTHGRSLGHVKDVAVHPDRRGEGVGRALLDRSLAMLASRGADSVKLEVRESNEAARSLYRSFGFEPLRRVSGYYEDDEDAIVMIRGLEG